MRSKATAEKRVPTSRPMTAEDLGRLAADGNRHELVKGELRTMPPGGGEHGFIGVKVVLPLWQHVKKRRLGVVLGAETGFIISRNPDTVRAPDVAFVHKDRVPSTGVPKGYWPGAPDLAVEVISPWDTKRDMEAKVQEWLAAQVGLVWVIDPPKRRVTVHRRGRKAVVLTEEDTLDGGDVIPEFSCPIADIFT